MIQQVVEALLTARPSIAEEVAAARALGMLADVIPPATFSRVVGRLVNLLEGPETTLQHRATRQYAAEGLRQLVPQMDAAQVNKVVRIVLEQLVRPQGREVTIEIIRLITAMLAGERVQIANEFHASILDQALILANMDLFRNILDRLFYVLAPQLPHHLRTQLSAYLHSHPDHLDSSLILELLGESPSAQKSDQKIMGFDS